MPRHTNKIGWQKYEDYIEKQLSSPLLHTIIQNITMQNLKDDDDHSEMEEDEEHEITGFSSMVPLTKQLIDDITMLSNFDCWIGHTNFDITPRIKEKLDKIAGIEILKICSRYRFFVGIGQMFDFTEVRNTIDKELKGD